MDAERAWGVIAEERRTLADLLEELRPDQWEHPSLCSAWRVRDVAAHVAMIPAPPGPLAMASAAVRARGSFHRMNQQMAVEHARLSPTELVTQIRAHADSRTIPVVTNAQNVLFDVLVHGQDIAVPLALPRRMDPEAARAGAERVLSMGWPFHARRRVRDLRLVATDIDWSFGSGAEVTGPMQAMLLVLTGRPAALTALDGRGSATLAGRLG